MPQMSDFPAALAWKIPPPTPFARFQVVPEKCQVPAPGWRAPDVPKTHTFLLLIAVMPVKRVPDFQAPRGSVRQAEPFQFSTEPPRDVTAQMFPGEGALAAAIQLCAPAGSGVACGFPFLISSAFGLPWPPTSVPPRNHAWLRHASTTSYWLWLEGGGR